MVKADANATLTKDFNHTVMEHLVVNAFLNHNTILMDFAAMFEKDSAPILMDHVYAHPDIPILVEFAVI